MRILLVILLSTSLSMAQNILITAHRGASGYAPENTLSAVSKALEIGVDRIEVDVQQTKDGVVVCLHDKTLDRTTSGKGKVSGKLFKEIEKLKANKGFEPNFADEQVPTLEQVFKLLDGSTEFVIEIKAGNKTYPNIEKNVVDLIRKYDAKKWAVVHSFNDKVLEWIHHNHPDIRLQKLFVSYSAGVMLDFKLQSTKLSKYDYVEGFGISRTGAKRKLVEKIHALGKTVHVWTVNEEADMKKLIEIGVDGIISNYPDKVNELLRNR